MGAIPDAGKVCAGSNACQNGGSYTKSCGCKCTDGYSGPLCNKCNLKCAGVGFTGHHEVGKCACACAPGYFDGIIDGRPAKCGLKIAASSPVVKAAIKVPTCKDHLAECPSWKENNYCTPKSRYHEYTQQKCPLSCDLCDKKKTAQIKVTAQGKFGFQYGDMLVAVPAGQRPWVASGGWAPGSVSQFICGPDGSYQRNLFCDETNQVTLKISTAGAFDVYFYRYKGKNGLDQSRGWAADATKMSFKACAGSGACVFPAPKLPKPSKLSDEEKAEVAQRVADARQTEASAAKKALANMKAKFKAAEKVAKKKKEHAELLAKGKARKQEARQLAVETKAKKQEARQLAVETKAKKAKAAAIRKEIKAKQAAAAKKNKLADERRHKVVMNINKHKKILSHLGRISAKLASEQAHMDATAPLA